MEKAKSIFASKTIWGGFIALLPALSDVVNQVAGIPMQRLVVRLRFLADSLLRFRLNFR